MSPIKTALAALALLVGANAATAQEFPTRPVRIIVPFVAGGPSDINARLVGERLERIWSRQVLIENRPGANTMIGIQAALQSPADGYTILWGSPAFSIGPHLFKAKYDPLKDFMPVSLLSATPHVMVVNPSVPAKNVEELIRYLKANGSKVSYASVGTGSNTHLEAELFKLMAGVEMQHIPYKGSAPAILDLVAGRVQVFFDGVGSELPYIRDGRVRAMAVTGSKRSSVLPEVPTMDEAGLKGYQVLTWVGVLVPTGTPAAIVERLNTAFVTAVRDPAVSKTLIGAGHEIMATSPAEFGSYLKGEVEQMTNLLKKANISGE